MTEERGYLVAGGRRLEFRRIGEPASGDPTLVYLHEGLGCVDLWSNFPDLVWQRTGLAAFSYSRAGYGRSDPCDLPRATTFMHEEALVILPQVLAEAQIDSAVLIGHSDGGSIALIHAGQVEGSPVRGLALMAPHVFNEPICVEAITNAGERYRGADLRERLEPHHRSNVDVAFWGWHDVWVHPEFRDWSIEPSLPGITVPTLVIQGDRDPYGTMRHLHAIRTSTSGRVEPVVLEGCGHSPHRERTEDTCAALVGFLSRLAQAAP